MRVEQVLSNRARGRLGVCGARALTEVLFRYYMTEFVLARWDLVKCGDKVTYLELIRQANCQYH